MKFACSMGFSRLWRIEWCDRCLRHVTGRDYTRNETHAFTGSRP